MIQRFYKFHSNTNPKSPATRTASVQ